MFKLGCRYFGISKDIVGNSLHVYIGLEDSKLCEDNSIHDMSPWCLKTYIIDILFVDNLYLTSLDENTNNIVFAKEKFEFNSFYYHVVKFLFYLM